MTTFLKLAETFAALEKTRSRLQMVQLLAALFDDLTKEEIQPAIYLLQGRLGPSYDAPDFGISEKLTTRVVAQFLGRPQGAIEAEYRKLGDHGLVVEKMMGRRRA
jgi:DNA ligase-1